MASPAGTTAVPDTLGSGVALYLRLAAARIRSDWQYRTSFFTVLGSQALIMVFEFLGVVFVLQLVPDLGGWTPTEVAFMYALATVPFGIADLLISSVEKTADHVQQGTFDRILLRPQPALFQLSANEFELRRIGRVIPPTAVLVWAIANVEVDWTLGRVGVLAMAIVCGVVIYGSLWVATASISFWAVASREAMNSITYGGQSANEYPLHLYRNWIRAILGWGIPLAFVSYVPSQWLLEAENPLGLPDRLILLTPVTAVAMAALSLSIWTIGVRHYQSTGS